MTAPDLAVVLGAGPVGQATLSELRSDDQPARIVTRTGRFDAPAGVEVTAADLSQPDDATRACAGAQVVYCCVGMGHQGWPQRWPPLMASILTGVEAAGARLVFMDNLYMYGPVQGPMREDLPLTDYGRKPAVRSELTRMWQRAHRDGRVEAAAVRASDFYGPGVKVAALGDSTVARIADGKAAQVIGDPDHPHAFTFVPDIARALVSVGRADDAMGEAWHVPNAPARSTREVLQLFAAALGQDLKVQVLPEWMMGPLGVFNKDIRELKELAYQWKRPFHVDATKFESRFWSDPTSIEDGVTASAASYIH